MTDKELLDKLLDKFYYCNVYKGLCYGYREDVTIEDVDPDLDAAIRLYKPDLYK
jgi:hypothetical protein